MAFSLADLERKLNELALGGSLGLPWGIFADLFPPGEPDRKARSKAAAFARGCGCSIENSPQDLVVIFMKDGQVAA